MSLSKKILLVAISGTIVTLSYFKVSEHRSQNGASSSSKFSPPKVALSKQPKITRRTHKSWAELTALSLRQGSGRNFAQQMQKVDSVALSKISSTILSTHKENPADTIAWLEELSLELTALNAHGQAALLLDLLSPFEETSAITGKVFSDWIQTNSAETFNFFKRLSEEDEISHWQLSVVAELFQGPHVELFDTYQNWIEESDLNLKGSLVGALVPHLLPENIDSVTEIILENLEHERQFGFTLSQLIEVRSPEDPVQNLEWLSQLDLPRSQIGTQVAAFGAAISHLARNDIDAATQIISQETFLPSYFPAPQEQLVDENGDWSADARWFFDEVLTHFIEEIRDTDPELAFNSVESFFDPIRREESCLSFQEDDDTTE